MIVSVGSRRFLAPVLKTLVHNAVLCKGNTTFHSRNWVAGNEHAVSDVWVLLDVTLRHWEFVFLSFETSGTKYPVTKRRMNKLTELHLYPCENLKHSLLYAARVQMLYSA
jgi:hypothetical protein